MVRPSEMSFNLLAFLKSASTSAMILTPLYVRLGIALNGIQDVQLMENAACDSHFPKRFPNSLATCIERDAAIAALEKQAWKDTKYQGSSLFLPERGGLLIRGFQRWNTQTKDLDILRARCLFSALLRVLDLGRLAPVWKQRVEEQSSNRVQSSQRSDDQPHGAYKKYSLW